MNIFELSDQLVEKLAETNPLLATEVGVAGHDARWPDLSPEGLANTNELWADYLAQAEAIEVETKRDSLAKRVLVEEAKLNLEAFKRGDHFYDLNNISSPSQALRDVFDVQPANTTADWNAIITRLETIAEPLQGYQSTLDQGRLSNRVVARRQVEAVIEQAAITAGDGSAFELLSNRLSQTDITNPDLQTRLSAAIDTAKAAYKEFKNYLADTYLQSAAIDDLVGIERYRQASKHWLGTELDLQATYRWGWDEVERLTARAQNICDKLSPGKPMVEVFNQLNNDPENDAGSAAAFVEIMTERQLTALAKLDGTHFDVPEQIRDIEVKLAPPGGPAGAYYVPPSEDFSRPGSVWYSLVGRESFPLHGEISTAYHEGFPGHHLQVGVQMVLADELSRFHRLMVWHPGSGEGWALYAEHLMGELGYFERPEYELGLVLQQLFRSCRIVIDIGFHCGFTIPDDVSFRPGESWTFDKAVELLTDRTAESSEMLTSEVTRYLGWPGQAISYKVGEKAILDIRQELSSRAGFDLKTFHSEILAIGSLGLDLTKELMLSEEY